MTVYPAIVHMALGRLLLDAPGRVVYHRDGRSEWPTYPADPARPNVGIRTGEERHWTRCGLISFDSSRGPRQIVRAGIRLDNARLVGRPCRRCWP